MPRTGHSRPPHHHPNTCANSIGNTVPMPDKSTPQGPVHRSSGTLASAPEGACVYRMVTAPVRDYSRRDRMLATQAATSLLLQLLVWLALFRLGFALVLPACARVGGPHALAQAGSSLPTLGCAGPVWGRCPSSTPAPRPRGWSGWPCGPAFGPPCTAPSTAARRR